MSNVSFNEFTEASPKQWKQALQAALKGADYNQTLVTETLEGISIKPFYTKEDINNKLEVNPPEQWLIAEALFLDQITIAQQIAKNALKNGVNILSITITKPFDFEAFFSDLPKENCQYYLLIEVYDISFCNALDNYLAQQNIKAKLLADPIGKLSTQGHWQHSKEKDLAFLKAFLKCTNAALLINATQYTNAGAHAIQQIAYTAAQCHAYFDILNISDVPKIVFNLAIGGHYFMEIAKFRAARVVFDALLNYYNWGGNFEIFAQPSTRNKTLYDYNVNMLRTTTECMSAILGNADIVCNLPYDAVYQKSNAFANRIARNQLHILKDESYFDAVQNPVDGTYYIEYLTTQLAEKGLALFKNIETSGGFIKALKQGKIQEKIKDSAQKEQALIHENKLVLVGSTKYVNKAETMQNQILLYPFLKTRKRQTLFPPIIPQRITEQLEKERLNHEKN